MIVFEKISVQNFMSVGNSPLVIDYTKSKTTLVTATNGVGKSSLFLDSISFALYGKPYRNITKSQLVNSINCKNLLVEITFSINTDRYVIKRGIKPNIFEIYKNSVLLNQDAAVKDYQKVLETNILKMNYRTFTQVVIMGSGNYIPFMKLTTAQRREFIEDVLDIKIFSTMNQLLKQKIKDSDDSERDIRSSLKLIKEKVLMQESFIKTLETEKDQRVNELQIKVDTIKEEISSSTAKIELFSLEVDQILDQTDPNKKIASKLNELKSIHARILDNLAKHNNDKTFYSELDVCPTCHQGIEDHHRKKIIDGVNCKIYEYEDVLVDIVTKMSTVESQLINTEAAQKELVDIQSKIGNLQSSISAATKLISEYQREITSMLTNSASTDAEKSKLKALSKEGLNLDKQRKAIMLERQYHDVAAVLLKDTGIKTRIIKQYIPVINKLINAYLQQMDLFVSFNLDENFNETVLSRYRDAFTYDSFSAGEKQRIDLALMFVFREIARIKNAVNINVLICDEILDQSLDSVGLDNFFSIIGNLSKTNLFVISHREGMVDKFDSNIKLIKKNNFTIME